MSNAFISTVVTTMSSLHRVAKDGEIIVKNKHINGLEIYLECVIITYSTTGFRCVMFVVTLRRY